MSGEQELPHAAPSSRVEDRPSDPASRRLSDEELKEIAETLGDLPALPDVVLRAIRLAQNPDWECSTLVHT